MNPNPAETPAAHHIASSEEVLATFTQILRSEKTSEQLKAAEQLAKYHSLFTPREDAAVQPELIAEIEAELQRIREARQSEQPRGPVGP